MLVASSLSGHVHMSRIFTCRILRELTKVCPAHRDKAEIKCMGSVGGKTPTEPNVCSLFSSLRHIERDMVDINVVFSI